MPTQYMYPTQARFNIPCLIAGVNAFGTLSKLKDAEVSVVDALVVGQLQHTDLPAETLRVLFVYLHATSLTLGVQACDVTRELLHDLELAGSPGTPEAD